MDQLTDRKSQYGLERSAVRRIVIGVMLAMFLSAIDQTIVGPALPTIGRDLGDLEHLTWVVTAYLLSATLVTPLYGKVADTIGRRTTLLTAIGVFIVGSVLCALAPTMLFLIVARFIQGLGGGGLIALGQTIVADIVPPIERMRYQAYFASVFVSASIIGPVFGGFFAEHLHWSLIFWINLPLGLLAFLISNGVLRQLPRVERPHRIDWIGAVLLAMATVTILLALSWGGGLYPWLSPEILGLFVVSLAAWVIFSFRLLRAPEPFIPLAVMFDRVVATGTGSNFFVVGTMVALSVYIPIYFEAVIGLSAGQSGFAVIALSGGTVMGAQVAARLMAVTPHYKRGPLIGLVVAIFMLGWLALEAATLPFWGVEALLTIAGLGMGTIYPVSTVAVQNAVQPHQLGTATAAFNFFRSLGSAILVAVFGAIFIGSLGVGGKSIGSLDALVAEAARNGTPIAPAFGYVFWAAVITVTTGLVAFALMEERPLRGRIQHTPGE